jgi:nicotinamidase-related amidase
MPQNKILLAPEQSLLLVIDLQEKFVPHLKHSKRIVQAAKLMIRTARELSIPVLVTEHNPTRIGPTIPELGQSLAGTPTYAKDIFSCFGDQAIAAAIAALKTVKNILVFGCETHICILQTVLDALNRGYGVHVAADGVGSRADLDWQFGLKRIHTAGAVMSTSEMMAYELLQRSDTPAFKALLPAFKEWTSRDVD